MDKTKQIFTHCASVCKSLKMLLFSIFVLLKSTCLATLFDRKFQVFKNSPKLTIFLAFLITFVHSKCNRSSVARNVECDFFERFSNTVPGSFRGMHCKRIRKATTIVENNYENIPPKPELDPVPKRSLEYFVFPLQKKLPDRDKYPYIYCC